MASDDRSHLAFAARLMTGALLPIAEERPLGVGGTLVFDAACEATGTAAEELAVRARRSGDLGTAIGEAVAEARRTHGSSERERSETERNEAEKGVVDPGLSLADAATMAQRLLRTNVRAEKFATLVGALRASAPLEARYLVRAILGEMRVGAAEGIVLDAIARGAGAAAPDVRRAAGLVSDVGELAELAFAGRLEEARPTLGRPLGFMLATPLETARGADLEQPHAVEDKVDGIRAQVHVSVEGVRIFARGKGPVTTAFPDIVAPLEEAVRNGLPAAILDAEIIVTDEGRPRPFSALQPRLKKTAPDDRLLRENAVRCLVYDILYEGSESLLALPFEQRRARLAEWCAKAPSPPLTLHASKPLDGPTALDAEFDAARARGFEGLVLKRLDAPYAAGVRGFAWLKVKRAFATLDVVVVAAERGHGKRAGVLSDYTFAIRKGDARDEFEVVGKAYSGLTDEEIASMTDRLQELALGEESHGFIRVRPEIVLEIAFDGIQRSDRHASGFALRFPRISRIRDDKRPDEVDTLETVQALWQAQLASGHREDLTSKDAPARGRRAKGTPVLGLDVDTGEATAPPTKVPKPAKSKGRRSGRKPDIRAKSKQLKLFDDD